VPIACLTGNTGTVTSGTLYLSGIWLVAGQVVSNITVLTGSTAGTTLTHGWFALVSSAALQLAHSADQTSGSFAASTLITKAMVTPYTVPSTGPYYAGFVCVASVQPTQTQAGGSFQQGASAFGAFPNAGPSSTGLTAPGTDGSTSYIAISASALPFYAYVS
jgi:hypothetical protein